MEAIEELARLSDSMRQAAALLVDDDIDDTCSTSSSRRTCTFLNVVALGNALLHPAGVIMGVLEKAAEECRQGSSAVDDSRTAFDSGANGPTDFSRTHSKCYSTSSQNGDLNASCLKLK